MVAAKAPVAGSIACKSGAGEDEMRIRGSLLFALLVALAPGARAVDYFLGADASPIDVWRECPYVIVCSPDSSINGHAMGGGLRLGAWLSGGRAPTALELGIARFGSISGNHTYYPGGCSLVFCQGPAAVNHWSNSATIEYLDWGGLMGSSTNGMREGVLGKIGIYHSAARTEGDYGAPGSAYARTVPGTGLMLGAAYLLPLDRGLHARFAVDLFLHVPLADPADPGHTTTAAMLMQGSLGLEYAF
jgi:hypothetical protein